MDSSPKHLDKFISSVTNHKMTEKMELEEVIIRPPPQENKFTIDTFINLTRQFFLTSYKKHTLDLGRWFRDENT